MGGVVWCAYSIAAVSSILTVSTMLCAGPRCHDPVLTDPDGMLLCRGVRSIETSNSCFEAAPNLVSCCKC